MLSSKTAIVTHIKRVRHSAVEDERYGSVAVVVAKDVDVWTRTWPWQIM